LTFSIVDSDFPVLAEAIMGIQIGIMA